MKHIYLIEDNLDIRELIEYLFSGSEFNIHGFATARTFWENIQRAHPDLIIMDVMLVDGNGVEICKKIKADETLKHIPILLMSANLNNKALLADCAAEDYISKPFDINDFQDRVQRLVL